MHRHLHLGGGSLSELIPRAVDEVGGPTILATFTVIAALLPMAFVSGLMGPYMSPIPINSSMGMLISLAVALIFTPWMCAQAARAPPTAAAARSRRHRGCCVLFERLMRPFLAGSRGDALTATGSTGQSWLRSRCAVRTRAEQARRAEDAAVRQQIGIPGHRQYAGRRHGRDHCPVLDELSQRDRQRSRSERLSGLCRHRGADQLQRSGAPVLSASSAAARRHPGQPGRQAVPKRARVTRLPLPCGPLWRRSARNCGASVQVVEVPPGPPVRAPIVAEVYGPRYDEQRQLAKQLRALFDSTPDMVDTDDSVEAPAPR